MSPAGFFFNPDKLNLFVDYRVAVVDPCLYGGGRDLQLNPLVREAPGRGLAAG
jgi:hypothetical protein